MRIVFDNIIFSLQTCGGISGMFSRLIEGLMKVPALELYFLERKDANRNVFRRRLNIPQERIISIDKYPLKIQRYINPGGISKYFGKGKRFIFHSSYYRYCTDPEAINISTLHDFTYEVMHMRGRVATYVHSRQKSNALSHSAAIACVSRSTLHDFYRFVGDRENQKIEVIPNAPLCTPTTNTTSLQAANEVLL